MPKLSKILELDKLKIWLLISFILILTVLSFLFNESEYLLYVIIPSAIVFLTTFLVRHIDNPRLTKLITKIFKIKKNEPTKMKKEFDYPEIDLFMKNLEKKEKKNKEADSNNKDIFMFQKFKNIELIEPEDLWKESSLNKSKKSKPKNEGLNKIDERNYVPQALINQPIKNDKLADKKTGISKNKGLDALRTEKINQLKNAKNEKVLQVKSLIPNNKVDNNQFQKQPILNDLKNVKIELKVEEKIVNNLKPTNFQNLNFQNLSKPTFSDQNSFITVTKIPVVPTILTPNPFFENQNQVNFQFSNQNPTINFQKTLINAPLIFSKENISKINSNEEEAYDREYKTPQTVPIIDSIQKALKENELNEKFPGQENFQAKLNFDSVTEEVALQIPPKKTYELKKESLDEMTALFTKLTTKCKTISERELQNFQTDKKSMTDFFGKFSCDIDEHFVVCCENLANVFKKAENDQLKFLYLVSELAKEIFLDIRNNSKSNKIKIVY